MATIPDPTGTSTGSASILSHNPNERKNRVPTGSELKGLRKLVESNSFIVESLERELGKLQVSKIALSNSILVHQRELEGMQSELFATNTLLDSTKLQISALRQGMENIKALIHPVRRLPAEILRHIFELAAGMSKSRVWEATRLSCVCKGWRETALDSPRLWTSIKTVAFDDSPVFWSKWIPLVKKYPVDIRINCIEEDDLALFREWHLSKIPNLRKLTVHFISTTNTNTIWEALLGPPYSPLSDIEVTSSAPLEVHHEKLISQFPGVTRLALNGNIALRFQEVASTHISTLILERMENVDIRFLLQHLPRLENLELRHFKLGAAQGPLNVTSSNLRRLKAIGTPLFTEEWAGRWRLPRLIALFNGDVATDAFVAFIRSNPSIKELDCVIETEKVIQCIPFLTEVTHLCISPSPDIFAFWREGGLQEAPFPLLEVLTLDPRKEELHPSNFEDTVRARCLPKNHPKSLLEETSLLLSELRVLVDDRDWTGDAWTRHELALEASMEVIPYSEVEGWFCVVLRWSS